MSKEIVIDSSITNLLGEDINESIIQECQNSPNKTGVIIKSHLYDKLPVTEVPEIKVHTSPSGDQTVSI